MYPVNFVYSGDLNNPQVHLTDAKLKNNNQNNIQIFVSRVGLVSKFVDQSDVELIGFDKCKGHKTNHRYLTLRK